MSNLEYTSFLIRLWREPPASVAPEAAGREWLVQVEHIPGGEKEYFASLEELFAFIYCGFGQSRRFVVISAIHHTQHATRNTQYATRNTQYAPRIRR